MELISWLLETEHWPARRVCGSWPGWLIAQHQISGIVIFVCYCMIPSWILLKHKKQDAHISAKDVAILDTLFYLFIASCGVTHLVGDVVMFDAPVYRLDGLLKMVCAAISSGTVCFMYWTLYRSNLKKFYGRVAMWLSGSRK